MSYNIKSTMTYFDRVVYNFICDTCFVILSIYPPPPLKILLDIENSAYNVQLKAS